jgi:maltose-binding protein MalE
MLADLHNQWRGNETPAHVVEVLPLPAGPMGDGRPFLTVDAFLFSAGAGEEQTRRALTFAEYATGADSQTLLFQEAHRVPVNVVAIARSDDEAIDSFVHQAESAVLLPSRPENRVLFAAGDELYHSVLEDGQEPIAAVAAFISRLDSTYRPPLAVTR